MRKRGKREHKIQSQKTKNNRRLVFPFDKDAVFYLKAPRAGPRLNSTPSFCTSVHPSGSSTSLHMALRRRPSKIALPRSPVSPSGPKINTFSGCGGERKVRGVGVGVEGVVGGWDCWLEELEWPVQGVQGSSPYEKASHFSCTVSRTLRYANRSTLLVNQSS